MASPDLAAFLARLNQNIFNNPYASEGKDAHGIFAPARRVTKKYGLTMRTIQFNGPRCIRYLIFDIDRPLGALAWEDANLPVPNLIITNPDNGHAHLVWELAKPVWRSSQDELGEAQACRYYKAVYKAMQRALEADPAYTGLLAKNPLHAHWTVTCGRLAPYGLAELSRHLELQSEPKWQRSRRVQVDGRRAILFETIRFWAYREKHHHTRLEEFHSAMVAELHRINLTFTKGPETLATLRSIAKSVSKWVWHKYQGTGIRKQKGIWLDQSLSLTRRQQLGQAKSAETKALETRTRIKTAIDLLTRQGVRLTKTAIAVQARLSRSTLYRHWKFIQQQYIQFDLFGELPVAMPAHSAGVFESLGSNTDQGNSVPAGLVLVPPAGADGPAAREGTTDRTLNGTPRAVNTPERIAQILAAIKYRDRERCLARDGPYRH